MEKTFVRILLDNFVKEVKAENKGHMLFTYDGEVRGVKLHAGIYRNIHGEDYTITINFPDGYSAPFTDNVCCPVTRVEQIIGAVKEYDKEASIRSNHHLCRLDFRIISERGDVGVYPRSLVDHIAMDFAKKIASNRLEFNRELDGLIDLINLYFIR